MRVGLVVPHIFMQDELLPKVIFSPGQLALGLANGLVDLGLDVTLFCAGPVNTKARLEIADLSGFRDELRQRGDSYLDLLRKHPLIFVSLARQAQADLIARAYDMANRDQLDVVHVYTNEEDLALAFERLCTRPVVFTHHDPFSFLVKYRHSYPKYSGSNWISLSLSQRREMPENTNWVANIPNGVAAGQYRPLGSPRRDYLAYLGRIIEPKGLHLAISAVESYNLAHSKKLNLRIAGKHYGDSDGYYAKQIQPHIDGRTITFDGYVPQGAELRKWLGNASALIVPSIFEEPFGMVVIEAMACGVPVIALDSGALGEIVVDGVTGYLVPKVMKEVIDPKSGRTRRIVDEVPTASGLMRAIGRVDEIDRSNCRLAFEQSYTLRQMCESHLGVYEKLIRG